MTTPALRTDAQLAIARTEESVREAWAVIVAAQREQGVEMLHGTPSFVIGVTHDGAPIQSMKTYPDGSQRVGCPPFPVESPLEQQRREAAQRVEREARAVEHQHFRQLEFMRATERMRAADRRLEREKLRAAERAEAESIERWIFEVLPGRIIPTGGREAP